MSNVPSSTPDGLAPEQAAPNPAPGEPAPMMMPNLLSPSRTVSLLSEVRSTQPVVALAAANQYQAELTPVFLEAVERALNDPANDFAQHGMIFNYAVYFLAQWRERRALPLFVRWFSLPGEDALELGGDTVTLDGARLLACVSEGEVGPIQQLVTNREANPVCRAVALASLGVSLAWQRWDRPEAEAYLIWLAREGLERTPGPVWNALTGICVHLEVLPAFPELRRARDEKLIPEDMLDPADLDKVTQAPRGELSAFFAEKHPPIKDIIHETRWWAGFQQPRIASPQPQRILKLPEKERVGRNDPCPCGSGKKFKKCCGA